MLKIMGKSQASIEQMRTYIKEVNPQVPDSVVKMIPLYIAEGTAEGVRGDIAFALALPILLVIGIVGLIASKA